MILLSALLLMATPAAGRPVTPAEQAAVKEAMVEHLKDAESARWRWPRLKKPSGGSYCVWVNAKNSYGGYTGFKPINMILVSLAGESPRVVYLPIPDDLAEQRCAREGYVMP